jgi:hypothetical protein
MATNNPADHQTQSGEGNNQPHLKDDKQAYIENADALELESHSDSTQSDADPQTKHVTVAKRQRNNTLNNTLGMLLPLIVILMIVFAVYFNFSGRLFPVILALFLLYLFITNRESWRDWIKGGATAFLGGILTLAPMGVQLAQNPSLFTGHMTDRLIFMLWDRMIAMYQTNDTFLVLWNQFQVNLLSFMSGMNGASFYPYPGQAMLSIILGPLFLLGLVFMIVRFKDARYALFAVTFWIVVIVNGIITIDSPQPHRLALALIPAIAGVALSLEWIAQTVSRMTSPALAPACYGGVLLIALVGGFLDLSYYLGPAIASKPWETGTAQARYVASLGPNYRVYTLGTPNIYFEHGTTRYLGQNVEGSSLHNPLVNVPMAGPADHDLAFMVHAPLSDYLPLIQNMYPHSQTIPTSGVAGTLFNTVLIPRSEIAAAQGLTAHYGRTERLETDPANLGGGATAFPAAASWRGSIYLPKNERYRFQMQTGAGEVAALKIDGAYIDNNRDYPLTTGWHALEIAGTLINAQSRVELRWQTPNRSMSTVPVYYLNSREVAGNLLCTVKPEGREPFSRLDRTIGFRSISDLIGTDKPATLDWEGTLNITEAGNYDFALNSSGAATLTLDGKELVSTQSGLATGTQVLSQGKHSFLVHYQSVGVGTLEVLWKTPNGDHSIIPPEAFTQRK